MLSGRTTGHTATTFVKPDARRRRARRGAQREIAAERVTDDERALGRMPPAIAPTAPTTSSMRHEWNSSRLRERLAVIAEVEPEHRESRVV